jgi:hypothetical protein
MRPTILVLALLLVGCASERKPFTIFGTWSGTMMTITDSQRHESVTLPIARYGYMNLALRSDSSYQFDLSILKDVVVDRPVLGLKENVVLIKAVYKSSRFGTFRGEDSGLVLTSKECVIFVRSDTASGQLFARFSDESNRVWYCTLVAKE